MHSGSLASSSSTAAKGFGDDVAFLKQHTPVVVLSDSAGKAKVAVSPALQGRVMTSTATGDAGDSFGWINRQYFADADAGKTNPHMGPYGGEDRIWLGPEGGQFSIFFAPKTSFDLDHWFTPKFIDVEPFDTVSTASDSASFRRKVSFANYSGTKFDIQLDRTVRLLSPEKIWQTLGISAPANVDAVAFETENSLTNAGSQDWTKQTGLLSIWILGMFNASPATSIVIPVKAGDEAMLGKPVNDDYFGKVPESRLKVIDNVVYFKGDANFRSKIGISPARTRQILGSYDPQKKLLTLVWFSFDPNAKDYVNSAWKIQDNPFSGDVANSYNDGPPPTGKPQLGKFYEMESSSPALALAKGQKATHVHRTMHFHGDEQSLEKIAKAALGVSLDQISVAFK
jgi:hypothetical protein